MNLVSPLKAMGQLASKSPGFVTLAQSPWRLLVIPTPNNKRFAGNPCNSGGLIKVPVLLALIIEGHVHLPHPPGNWTVWLRTFLVEATSTTNDHLFSAQNVIAEAWWDIQSRFTGTPAPPVV